MHGSRYNLLGCKKKLDMRMNIYSMFKRTAKTDAPFTSDLQMPLSWVQIDECTSYELESSKPPLCWIRHVFYFVARNLECPCKWQMYKVLHTNNMEALINVYIWIAKASIACISNRSHWNKHMHMLEFNRVWVSDRPIFFHTRFAKFMILSKNNNAIYILI